MSGYVFHCSKCRVAHAGECPPDTRPTIADVDQVIEGYNVQIYGGFGWPKPKSVWKAEIYDPSTNTWTRAHYDYQVVGWMQNRQRTSPMVTNTVEFVAIPMGVNPQHHKIDLDAWTPNGAMFVDGRRMRMVRP